MYVAVGLSRPIDLGGGESLAAFILEVYLAHTYYLDKYSVIEARLPCEIPVPGLAVARDKSMSKSRAHLNGHHDLIQPRK